MDLSVFFAGTAASSPTANRGLSSVVVTAGGDRLLFDCGEGTQRQLIKTIGLPEIDAIFITHFHADHWLGLPGILKTFDLRGREKPLDIYGPTGLDSLLTLFKPVYGRVGYELRTTELEPYDEVRLPDRNYVVSAVSVDHRVTAYGYAIVEDDRPGHFHPDKALELGVNPGPDFGRLQRGEPVGGVTPEQVLGEPRRGRRIVISGDTAPCQAIEVFAHKADVLVHEATFANSDAGRARETGHSTAKQAADIAHAAEVELLVLTHISTRYFPRDLRSEAEAEFSNSVVARDFDRVEIPFPERGRPKLVNWQAATN